MNEVNNEELEIDLSELLLVLKRKWRLILIATLSGMIIAAVATIFLFTKKYESNARVFPKTEKTDAGVDYTQLNANDKLINNYMELMKGSTILDQVAVNLNIDASIVYSSISVSNQTGTQIITISAKTDDPELSKKIVDEIVLVFYDVIKEKLDITNVLTVDQAKVATAPVSPSLKMNLVIGAVLGIFLSGGFVFLQFMLDTRIHNKEEAEKYFDIPVLGIIPDFEK